MNPVFAKLNLKGQREIVAVDVPASFEPALRSLEGVTVLRDPARARSIGFALAFATSQAAVDALAVVLCAKAEDDALLWFAYPKASSKLHRCDFNRDSGWRVLREAGFDSVRAVAIDDDWTALRFRRVEHIRSR